MDILMDIAGAVGSLVALTFGIIASFYVVRWVWRQGDRISGIEEEVGDVE